MKDKILKMLNRELESTREYIDELAAKFSVGKPNKGKGDVLFLVAKYEDCRTLIKYGAIIYRVTSRLPKFIPIHKSFIDRSVSPPEPFWSEFQSIPQFKAKFEEFLNGSNGDVLYSKLGLEAIGRGYKSVAIGYSESVRAEYAAKVLGDRLRDCGYAVRDYPDVKPDLNDKKSMLLF